MSITAELAVGQITSEEGVTVERLSGRMKISASAGVVEVLVPENDDYCDLYIRITTGWVLAVPERGHLVSSWADTAASIAHYGPITRLDVNGYDPGALYRVNYHAIDGSSCLIETEVGFCLVDRLTGIRWEDVHDDLTCRISYTSHGLIHTRSDYGADTYSLNDGTFVG